MAKTNIDPAFQAAPFLGESSHDPVQFAREQKMLKYQEREKRRKEEEENLSKGLEKLALDAKAWEDNEGFKEITGDHNKIINAFIELTKKGVNINAPKTEGELMAYKTINQKLSEVKQKVDMYNRNKMAFDMATQAIKQDALRDPNDQVFDYTKSRESINKAMQGKTIADRNFELDGLLVYRPNPNVVTEFTTKNKDFLYTPPIVTEPYTDPVTGKAGSTTKMIETPEEQEKVIQSYRDLYKKMSPFERESLKAVRELNKEDDKKTNMDTLDDEDYYVTLYNRPFKQKMIDKLSGGSGGGVLFGFNFGGQNVKFPGEKHDEPVPYGTKTYTGTYMFPATSTAKSLTVPIGAQGSEQFMGQSWAPIKEGTVEATIYLYDPAKDEFVFNVTSNQNAPWVQNNRPVSIPRYILGDLADNLPIKDVDGKIKKLKDVFGPIVVVKKELPGIDQNFWNKSNTPYIPKKNK